MGWGVHYTPWGGGGGGGVQCAPCGGGGGKVCQWLLSGSVLICMEKPPVYNCPMKDTQQVTEASQCLLSFLSSDLVLALPVSKVALLGASWCPPPTTPDPLAAELWLLNSCTVKGPSEDALHNAVRRGHELGRSVVVAGCVPQGQRDHPQLAGVSVVGVQQIDRVVEVVEETLKGRWGEGGGGGGRGKEHGYSIQCIHSIFAFNIVGDFHKWSTVTNISITNISVHNNRHIICNSA